LALAVPLSRFTSRVGGGSALFVRRLAHAFMTPIQFATLLIRFYCIFALVLATAALSEIAYGIYVVITSTQTQYESQREFLLAMYVVRFFIYFGTGIGFLIFTKPLARLLAKGLDSIKHDDAA